MKIKFHTHVALFLVVVLSAFLHSAVANPMRAPEEKAVSEARILIDSMKQNPRGPYRQIRWFCNDGSVLPPNAYACAGHGGGRQHAEYSSDRAKLAELGWSVGTIFAAMSWDEFWDINRNHQRMREIPLEQYMVDIDNGWVLEKAKNYRGRVQIEGEEASGRQLLLRLTGQPDWIANNFLLMRELVRTVPHGGGDDRTRDIRRVSQNIAEQEPSFQNLRIEIHTTPSASTIKNVQAWSQRFKPVAGQDTLTAELKKLTDDLEALYGEAGRAQRLNQMQRALGNDPALVKLQTLLISEQNESPLKKLERLGLLLASIRESISLPISAAKRLQLLDTITDIEAETRLTAETLLQESPFLRQQLLQLARSLVASAYGGGYLSNNEKNILIKYLDSSLEKNDLAFDAYQSTISSLNMAGSWALGSVRYTFTEPLLRYTALDARAGTFVDDMLRGSPLLQLAQITRYLAFDAQNISQVQKTLFGESATALMALNPGIAMGPLYIATEQEIQNGLKLGRENIVVLPQTVSELPPVSGVMTVGESNMLSHVQLLARNFGIPNVALSQGLLDQLKPYHGKQIVLAATSDGSVIISTMEQLSSEQHRLVNQQSTATEVRLTAPVPDLSLVRPLPINEINVGMSGKVVGPKAANLSKLYSLFPGKVAPAIALPFGLFFKEVNQHEDTNWQNLQQIYKESRAGSIDQTELTRRLEQLRDAVLKSSPGEHLRAEIRPLMRQWFGEPGSYGVFVRSDTNVEDLPGFTGAGLSETLPHIVGPEQILNSVPRVWASVLAPRAIAWRSNLLTNPEQVYPSVLLMKSVPAEKSGVLVTRDLYSRQAGLTVSTAWGVGGAVSGESTETLVLKPDGSDVLLSEAKTAYQRVLLAGGGVNWKPANSGSILSTDEKRQLREIAAEINDKYGLARDDEGNTLPWDIEFGFIKGELQLFQIRPLIERGQVMADRFINREGQASNKTNLPVVKLDAEVIQTVESL